MDVRIIDRKLKRLVHNNRRVGLNRFGRRDTTDLEHALNHQADWKPHAAERDERVLPSRDDD